MFTYREESLLRSCNERDHKFLNMKKISFAATVGASEHPANPEDLYNCQQAVLCSAATKADWQQVIGRLATQGLRKLVITLFNAAMVPVLDQQGKSMKGAEIMQYSKPSV